MSGCPTCGAGQAVTPGQRGTQRPPKNEALITTFPLGKAYV